MLLLIDGPEKAGKTTLLTALAHYFRPYGWHVVHCKCRRPTPFNPSMYLDAVQLGARTDTVVLLDRAWPAEVVYNQMLSRDTVVTADEFEWLIGRAVPALGAALILLPPPDVLENRRAVHADASDHPISAAAEHDVYSKYAVKYGYDVETTVDEIVIERLVDAVVRARDRMELGLGAPQICGTPTAPIAVVGEAPNTSSRGYRKMGWLPFTSTGTMLLMNATPATAYHSVLWTNASTIRDVHSVRTAVSHTKDVIALGHVAEKVVTLMGHANIHHLPHPSAIVRWPSARKRFNTVDYSNSLSGLISSALNIEVGSNKTYDEEEV